MQNKGFVDNKIKNQIKDIQEDVEILNKRVEGVVNLYNQMYDTQNKQGDEISDMKQDLGEIKKDITKISRTAEINRTMILNHEETQKNIRDSLRQVEVSLNQTVQNNTDTLKEVSRSFNALTQQINEETVSRMDKDYKQDLALNTAIDDIKGLIYSNTNNADIASSDSGWKSFVLGIAQTSWFQVLMVSIIAFVLGALGVTVVK